MQIGMIGLGRMGANMTKRLLRAGNECVVYDPNVDAVKALEKEGAIGTSSLEDFVSRLKAPRPCWLMIPAALVDSTIEQLKSFLKAEDIIIDGGNSYYIDDIRRAAELKTDGIHYLDVGTSGGVWGLERGYCQMIGGEPQVVQHLEPIFKALAPGQGTIPVTEKRSTNSTADQGYLHCGLAGAGHFVKMVHNGIEYGLMAAYAEGFNVLHGANAGNSERAKDAETTPLRHPQHHQYDFNIGDIAELWRRGSVVASWLLDLTANALAEQPDLSGFAGRVSDSGEGRWTIAAAVEQGTPVPVLSSALFARFTSQGEADFANRLLSAMRFQFGGHVERREK